MYLANARPGAKHCDALAESLSYNARMFVDARTVATFVKVKIAKEKDRTRVVISQTMMKIVTVTNGCNNFQSNQ